MKKGIRIIGYIFLLFSICYHTQAQVINFYYLAENFEDPDSISRWSIETTKPAKVWKYTYGGQWQYGGYPYNPEIPLQGNYNAGVYYPSLTLDYVKLISPALEMGGAAKPTLRFWHCQYENVKGPDHLRLLFRTSPSAEWDLIQEWTNDISYWKDETFDIENIDTKYLTDSFQLSLEGVVGNGFGVYLDSITVKEEAIVEKYVKKVTYRSVEYDAIPGGGTDIPMEEIVIRVLGNSGEAVLDSLTIVPTGVGVPYLEETEFKLFYTNGDLFAPWVKDTSTLISTASLIGGKVVFADVDFTMALGDNHFWVAGSIKTTLQGSSTFKFSIPAGGINVSDTLLPSTAHSMSWTHKIYESRFYEDFETGGTGWTLEPNFEVGWPEGNQVGTQRNPETPFNGSNILKTDLNGAYYPNITSATAYYAYTPELDLKYYINTSLYLQSYFLINGPDDAVIDISVDGGSSWQNIWTSDPSRNNSYWSEYLDATLNDIADRKSQFQLRFGIVESKTVPWPGFGIDNFAILAEKLNTDVGVTQIIYPFDDCLDCGNDTVRAWIRNYADASAPSMIPVYFGLWGSDSILVRDTILGGIAKDDSVLFTFTQLANFPRGDIYDEFVVGIDLASDQDASNDTLTKPLLIQQNITPPHVENFEYKGGVWLPQEGSTWLCKDMSGTITTDPESPNIWVLSPFGNYPDNDTSFVVSSCYDLSGDERNMIQFEYWSDCEATKDGARFEYSIDDGNTWSMLEDPVHSAAWNWCPNYVSALGSNGWSGIVDWTTAKAIIPETVDTYEKVKFRFLFRSDNANAQPQGFAFDDLSIFTSPIDVGVSTIVTPQDACQYEYADELNLWVKNFGYNDLHPNDTIIVGFDFESDPAIIDTFLLSTDLPVGDSTMFTFPTTFDISSPGTYQIRAYTLIEDDPWFYGSNNDTTLKLFETWENPITGLVDTIQSREVDTVIIRPIIAPNYSYLWDDNSTDNYFDVQVPGTVYLTVTETVNGCQTEDSVYIELLFNDVGIDSIIWPVSSCELSTAEHVQLQIHNFGTDSLIIGDKIVLFYELNSGTPVTDSIILDAPLYSGTNLWFTFEERTENFSAIDDYSIKAYTHYGGDTVTYNDTLERTITVFGYPTLNLGNDTVINGVSYMLDVDPSFSSYLWNDGVTQGTRLIDTSGVYWLDIIDQHGCPTSDTINIWFRIRDVRPLLITSPVSECNRTDLDYVTVRVENYGSDTISSANTIYVSYTINSGARITESFSVSQLRPGQRTDHTFAPQIDLTTLGTYNFEATATTSGDMRVENDTFTRAIHSSTNPVIDLGIDPEETHYVTELVIDAGYGENWIYMWQDGSTNRTYTATNSGPIRVLVTDTTTGCYGGDTTFVIMDILDYMVTSVSLNANSCSGVYNEVEVLLLNNGNLTRQGAEITLEFLLGSQLLFTDIYSTTIPWQAGAINTYTTDNTISLTNTGTQQLHINITATGDIRPENDDYTKNINVLPSPVVDFGGENLQVGLPYTLNAGSGYASYLWSDGSDESTLTVTDPGTYSVTVTGTNGCQTVESVGINVTAISDLAGESMKVNIYPNPARDYITVEALFGIPGTYIMEVFNAQNSKFYSREITGLEFKETLYTDNLPPGLYFIRIRNEVMYHVSKIVIH